MPTNEPQRMNTIFLPQSQCWRRLKWQALARSWSRVAWVLGAVWISTGFLQAAESESVARQADAGRQSALTNSAAPVSPSKAANAPARGGPSLLGAEHDSELPAPILRLMQTLDLPAQSLSVVLRDVQSGLEPMHFHAQEERSPASLIKLVTTQAALDLLGPAFVWQTPVYVTGPIQGGVLQGSVYVRGSGDPKFNLEAATKMLQSLKAMGVQRIEGDWVIDKSLFDAPAKDPGAFDGEPFKPYNVGADAMLVNFNALLLTFTPDAVLPVAHMRVQPPLWGLRDPLTVPLSPGPCADYRSMLMADFSQAMEIRMGGTYPKACGQQVWPMAPPRPQEYSVRALAGLWRDLGGEISGEFKLGSVPKGLMPLWSQDSPTLAEVIRDMNKYSNNVMAHQLYLSLSAYALQKGSDVASAQILRQWWKARFTAPEPLTQEGSGLSRDDRMSARAFTQLLQYAWESPYSAELIASLPIAGIDGTLKRSHAAGGAHLKTGSLNGVLGVAGYVQGKNQHRYSLVVLINHPNAAKARPLIDAWIEWAANH